MNQKKGEVLWEYPWENILAMLKPAKESSSLTIPAPWLRTGSILCSDPAQNENQGPLFKNHWEFLEGNHRASHQAQGTSRHGPSVDAQVAHSWNQPSFGLFSLFRILPGHNKYCPLASDRYHISVLCPWCSLISLHLVRHILSPFLPISFPCLPTPPPYLFIYFKIDVLFRVVFLSRIEWKAQRSAMHPSPTHTYTTSPIINILHRSGAFVTTDESTRTHHYHPKCTVYIRVHSCCAIHEFGQTYDDMCPPSRYQTEHFHCPEHPLLSILLLLKRHFL